MSLLVKVVLFQGKPSQKIVAYFWTFFNRAGGREFNPNMLWKVALKIIIKKSGERCVESFGGKIGWKM